MQIAIDGYSAAGKSTVAKIVAKKLGFVYIDTGAMYRAVTLEAMQQSLKLDDIHRINQMLKNLQITFKSGNPQKVFIINHSHAQEVTHKIRSQAVTDNVSQIAAMPEVRKILTKWQRQMANQKSVIMDGRDIGTTVLPHARVKIFLTASVLERAKRRLKDNKKLGIKITLKNLEHSLKIRDYKDSHRKVSPLRQAKDATRIDTTDLSIKQVVDKIIEITKRN